MLAESVSQSVFYKVLNAVSDDMVKRKCLFNIEMFFLYNNDLQKN